MAKKEAAKQQPASSQVAPAQPSVDFEVWWAMAQKKMPGHHHKEIIKADFRARGLSMREPAAAFNEALELYGVKLK
jgi:hypothetical protein